jgi:hypothetical protein
MRAGILHTFLSNFVQIVPRGNRRGEVAAVEDCDASMASSCQLEGDGTSPRSRTDDENVALAHCVDLW